MDVIIPCVRGDKNEFLNLFWEINEFPLLNALGERDCESYVQFNVKNSLSKFDLRIAVVRQTPVAQFYEMTHDRRATESNAGRPLKQ